MSTYEPSSTDAELLVSVATLWEQLDPPPHDLADGVLARLAAEDPDLDMELELLTLVESGGLAGVRHATDEETGAWSLEYAGPDFRLYLQLTRIEDHVRLDGWVVPARPLTVELRPEDGPAQRVELDELGRFAFPGADPGAHRLAFVEERPLSRPRVTPPFWI